LIESKRRDEKSSRRLLMGDGQWLSLPPSAPVFQDVVRG
jgi:hypothetical protein